MKNFIVKFKINGQKFSEKMAAENSHILRERMNAANPHAVILDIRELL